MGEMHLIDRNVGIVLTIVCGILLAFLVGTFRGGLEKEDVLALNKSVVCTDNESISEGAGRFFGYYVDNSKWNVEKEWPYAGYATVQVLTSTSDKTYIEVMYWYEEVEYYTKKDVGRSGNLSFPVLPGDTIAIVIGNEEPVGSGIQNQTVTITYHY
jgi:hypothetical protein